MNDTNNAVAAQGEVRASESNPVTLGDDIVVSHGRASGHIARVFSVGEHTFSATCQCGWKLSAMRTAGYLITSRGLAGAK